MALNSQFVGTEAAKADHERRKANHQTIIPESMEDFWPQWKGAVSPVSNTFTPARPPYVAPEKDKTPTIGINVNSTRRQSDMVNHPPHYTSHPSGVECITITQHMGFNLGNALKYIWRADLKNDTNEDLKKAVWYINRELEKRGGTALCKS